MAAGRSYALHWGHWSQLELAVSGMGQPWLLLTEATPDVPAACWCLDIEAVICSQKNIPQIPDEEKQKCITVTARH